MIFLKLVSLLWIYLVNIDDVMFTVLRKMNIFPTALPKDWLKWKRI